MGFEAIEPRTMRNGKFHERVEDQVRLAVYQSGGKHTLAFNIGMAVMRRIGCKIGDRVSVLEGNAGDRGKFLVAKAEPGARGYSLAPPPNEAKLPKGAPVKYGRVQIPCELLKYSRPEGPIALHPVTFIREEKTLTADASGFLVPRKPGT